MTDPQILNCVRLTRRRRAAPLHLFTHTAHTCSGSGTLIHIHITVTPNIRPQHFRDRTRAPVLPHSEHRGVLWRATAAAAAVCGRCLRTAALTRTQGRKLRVVSRARARCPDERTYAV